MASRAGAGAGCLAEASAAGHRPGIGPLKARLEPRRAATAAAKTAAACSRRPLWLIDIRRTSIQPADGCSPFFVAPARLGEGGSLVRPRSSPASGRRRRRRRIKLRSLRAEMQNGRQLGRAPAWAALEDCCGSITWRRRRPKSGHYLARRGLARWLGRVGQKTIRVHCASPP